MTFSREPYQANTLRIEDTIDAEDLAYFRQRMKNHAFQELMKLFAESAEEKGLTKSNLAGKLGKDRAQISRIFAGPMNWTIDTLSDLSLALGYQADVTFRDLNENPRNNYRHPYYEFSGPLVYQYEVENGTGRTTETPSTTTSPTTWGVSLDEG